MPNPKTTMTGPHPSSDRPVHTYNNGQPYQPSRGHSADRKQVEHRQQVSHKVITGKPDSEQFLRVIIRELKIRGYSQNSIASYRSALRRFLAWFGNEPHRVTIEHVRNYLELLVDGGASTSHLSVNLCAIRTAFDKLCMRDVTLGLATPRKKKTQPTVLSQAEVKRMLVAAPRLSIKLAIGIMYSAGLRNSELCKLRVRDLDFDRGAIFIRQGKGKSDRTVMLPKSFEAALRTLYADCHGDDFLFSSQSQNETRSRHLSPRTLQRWVKLCAELAEIKKVVTPHAFRHSFATHLLESGTDIRFIQKLLGHQRLETTTIYTRVARVQTMQVQSPLDRLNSLGHDSEPNQQHERPQQLNSKEASSPSVGSMVFELKPSNFDGSAKTADVTLWIRGPSSVQLTGISVRQNVHNWVEIHLPLLDAWSEQISLLPKAQQQRIESPEFFELVRREITRRFLDWVGSDSS